MEQVVLRDEWLVARKELLAMEKEEMSDLESFGNVAYSARVKRSENDRRIPAGLEQARHREGDRR